jgi:hypothetical protein
MNSLNKMEQFPYRKSNNYGQMTIKKKEKNDGTNANDTRL